MSATPTTAAAPALSAAELAELVPVTPIAEGIDTAAALAYVEPRAPKYHAAQTVIALYDLSNDDGSHPDQPPGALLVARGTVGEIVNVGHAQEDNEPVYLVDFERRVVVGCLEDEILPAPPGLLPETDAAPGAAGAA